MIYACYGDVRLTLSIPAMQWLIDALHQLPFTDNALNIELKNFESNLECEIIREAIETVQQATQLIEEYATIWIPQSLNPSSPA